MRRTLCLLMALTALAAGPAHAAPGNPGQPSGDALLQMLHDKGLVPLQQAGRTLVEASQSAGRAAGDAASDLVVSAMNFLGVPYRRGGNSAEQGFDCSGFTRHLFESTIGLVLPRRSDEQALKAGLQEVQKSELQPGDLVFFNTMRRAFSHVGVYIGEGRFIHSPRAGGQVRVESMGEGYWTRRFDGARRVDWPAAEAPGSALLRPAMTPTAGTTTR
jgi:cell wall-associated NlpC family hydrolase